MSGWFVTGTDTGVGKTMVAVAMLTRLNGLGHRAVGMKPVASGCTMTPEGLRSSDAELLQAAGAEAVAYQDLNPYAFVPAVAPHLAAASAGETIEAKKILAAYARLQAHANCVIVEGVGGWRVPLAPDFGVRELALQLDLPIILVVGLRLGCLNHALLTQESIACAGLTLAGWVANQIDPHMLLPEKNLASLEANLNAPLIGTVPFLTNATPAEIAKHLEFANLAC